MKSIARTLLALLLFASATAVFAGASNSGKVWVCPMPEHAQEFEKPGTCPICGMELVEKEGRFRVAVLIFDNAEDIDFTAPIEVLGQAGALVFTVGPSPDSVTTVFGLHVRPDYDLEHAPEADLIFVPGGGVNKMLKDDRVLSWIRERANGARYVMSVCNGAFILGKAGLLDNMRATTTASLIDALAVAAPKTRVVRERVVDNGKMITTAGLSAGIDGALHVIEREYGRTRAEDVARGIEYRWEPDSHWTRASLADIHLPDITLPGGLEMEEARQPWRHDPVGNVRTASGQYAGKRFSRLRYQTNHCKRLDTPRQYQWKTRLRSGGSRRSDMVNNARRACGRRRNTRNDDDSPRGKATNGNPASESMNKRLTGIPRLIRLSLITIAVALPVTAVAVAADHQAEAIVRAAIKAQGGEEALHSLRNVLFDAVGYRDMVEQSERPEGPYVIEFDRVTELHDLAGNRFRRTLSFQVPPLPETSDTLVLAGGVGMRKAGANTSAASARLVQQMQESLALSPERVLLTALDSPTLHREPDTKLHGIVHHVVSFDFKGAPVRVYLNANTLLPTMVETSGASAHGGYWSYLGDVTMRTWYSSWALERGGVHYPMQWNVERNGLQDRVLVISRLALDGAIDELGFVIPDGVRMQAPTNAQSGDLESLPLGFTKRPAFEIAPGVVFIPGSWNVTLVRQSDGVVVIEAPISSGYSAKVIDEAGRRFPGVPIKAVITTSDSWPHLAGIREYVARDIPVYALDLNRQILERVIGDRRTSKPDTLSHAPRKPLFHFVSTRTTLGDGSNLIELYPSRGATSERQMLAYFPEHRLLYGSDLCQKNSDTEYFTPQTVGELVAAVGREHLAVDRFFMMHVDPTSWQQLVRVLTIAYPTRTHTIKAEMDRRI